MLTGSCTGSTTYGSSTTVAGRAGGAWMVLFDGGAATNAGKDFARFVRAVRGGSAPRLHHCGRALVPTYDLRCSGCKKKFSLTMGIAERSRKRIKCPKCASQKVEAVFSMFFAKTSRKA